MMIKFKLLQFEKVFNIFQATGYQVIHTNHLIPFPDKFIAKMGAESVRDLLGRLELDDLSFSLRHQAANETSQQRKSEALKRLRGSLVRNDAFRVRHGAIHPQAFPVLTKLVQPPIQSLFPIV